METEAFENVKEQIGRCGIWCGSFVVGDGTLRTLAERCEHIIGGYGIDEWGVRDFDGKELMKGLASIQTLPICQGCLKGGGNESCKIRPCASIRKLSDWHGMRRDEDVRQSRSAAESADRRPTRRHVS